MPSALTERLGDPIWTPLARHRDVRGSDRRDFCGTLWRRRRRRDPARGERRPHATVGPDNTARDAVTESERLPGRGPVFRGRRSWFPGRHGAHGSRGLLMYQERWADAHEELVVAGRLAPDSPGLYLPAGSRIPRRQAIRRARACLAKIPRHVPPTRRRRRWSRRWIEDLGSEAVAR